MEPMNLRIGEKLKSIRMARTLSLDDTAALSWGTGRWRSARDRPSASGPTFPTPIRTRPGTGVRSTTPYSIQAIKEGADYV